MFYFNIRLRMWCEQVKCVKCSISMIDCCLLGISWNDILTMTLCLFMMADILIMPPKQRGRPSVVSRTTRSSSHTPSAAGNPPTEADITRIINEQLAATIPAFLAQFHRDMANGPAGNSNPGGNGGPKQPVDCLNCS